MVWWVGVPKVPPIRWYFGVGSMDHKLVPCEWIIFGCFRSMTSIAFRSRPQPVLKSIGVPTRSPCMDADWLSFAEPLNISRKNRSCLQWVVPKHTDQHDNTIRSQTFLCNLRSMLTMTHWVQDSTWGGKGSKFDINRIICSKVLIAPLVHVPVLPVMRHAAWWCWQSLQFCRWSSRSLCRHRRILGTGQCGRIERYINVFHWIAILLNLADIDLHNSCA